MQRGTGAGSGSSRQELLLYCGQPLQVFAQEEWKIWGYNDTPGTLEAIRNPTCAHFTDGKTEVKKGEGPNMKSPSTRLQKRNREV